MMRGWKAAPAAAGATALLLLIQSAHALYSSNSPVKQLDESNFKEQVLKDDGVWMVEFYAPWCGHCKALTEHWEKSASIMSGVVNVAAVDATENPKLAQKYGVQGYPTIKIFGADKRNPTDYQGQRQTDDIVSGGMAAARKLVKDRHSGKAKKSSGKDSKPKKDSSSGAGGRKSPASDDAVIELTSSNFDSVVLDSDEQFFVEFYAPWCGHCQRLAPEWKEAATELQGVVNFGAVDATEHQDLAQRYGVQGFPTIFIWKAGPKGEPMPYNGPREAQAIIQEATNILDSTGFTPGIRQLTEASLIDSKCKGRKICVLAVLPHIVESGKSGREAYLDTLTKASKKLKSTSFVTMWSEAGAQSALEQDFGLTFGFPAMVAFSAEKNAYAVLLGAFDVEHIATFLGGILIGSTKTQPFESMPQIVTVSEWDGEDAPVFEEEFSLEELMAEEL